MTELQEILDKQGVDALLKRLETFSNERLLVELDDVLEFDLWRLTGNSGPFREAIRKTAYGYIIKELRNRLK